jgi:hypothetical protein
VALAAPERPGTRDSLPPGGSYGATRPTTGVSGASAPAPPAPGSTVGTPPGPGGISGTLVASGAPPAPTAPTEPPASVRSLRIEFVLVAAATGQTRVTYRVTAADAGLFTLRLAYTGVFANGRRESLEALAVSLEGSTSYTGSYQFGIDAACKEGVQRVVVTAATTPDAPGEDPQRSLACPGAARGQNT